MIRWTGLASWEFGFPSPGSLTSTFLRAGAFLPATRNVVLPEIAYFGYRCFETEVLERELVMVSSVAK